MPEKRVKYFAFTLAETLITLTIVGVIAALTIPTIVHKIEDVHTVSALKEANTILSNAFSSANLEYGPPPWNSVWSFEQQPNDYFNKLSPYIKTSRICRNYTKGCLGSKDYKNLSNANGALGSSGYTDDSHPYRVKAILTNGMSINITMSYSAHTCDKNYCTTLYVDVNGPKGPNRYGYDYFGFSITPSGIVPSGLTGGTCNRTLTSDVNNGLGCTAWVLQKGNLEYKYKDGNYTFKK